MIYMKEKIKIIKTNIKEVLTKSSFWFFNILFLETIFNLLISNTSSFQWLLNILLSTLILSQILSLIGGILTKKANIIFTAISLTILGMLFSLQAVFYKIFKVYFSLYNIGLKDQVKDFLKDAIILITKNSFYIIIFILPLIVYITNIKKIPYQRFKRQTIINFIYSIIFLIIIFISHISIINNNTYSTYNLYHNINNINLNIKNLGVINTYVLETNRILVGYKPKITKNDTTLDTPTKNKKEKIYKENKLELNFKNTDKNAINSINDYIKNDQATFQNEYTGIFKNYNLIYITAESFSKIGVNKDLTPTLYKLTHSGFVFNNFYTPNNLSTIGGEFQSLTGLYPDAAILNKWREGTNYFPYGLANTFKKEGYNTFAYHNNSYVFQDRNKYLESQGFTNFQACYNGLEEKINCNLWPQSDDEMIKATTPDYLNSDKPFLTYYMTVSGHFEYDFDNNAMAYKHMDEVNNLNLSESAKAYIATQIELDNALEHLIKELEKSNKLDNTVIVLLADHYPYELDNNAINQLSDNKNDEIEINHNNLIIWNKNITTTKIDKASMAVDVIPTIYNLFGINYDSRLFTGKDILSNSLGIAVLSDRSWITDKGTYYASTGEFKTTENIDSNYISSINNLINNRLNISRLIIEYDYYKYLFE